MFDSRPTGTTFCFAPGTYVLTTHVYVRSNDRLIAATPRTVVFTGLDQYNGGFIGYGGAAGNHDVLIQGFVFQHFLQPWPSFPRAAIQAGDNWTVENNEIAYNSQSGVSIGDGMRLLGNWIHHNGRYGFTGGPGSNMLIANNDVSFNNTAHLNPNDDAGGSKIVQSTGIVFRSNSVHDNWGNGLWCDWANSNVTYEDNILAGNYLAGIFHEASDQAVIRNNSFSGNGLYAVGRSVWYSGDLMLDDSSNTEIYGNTIVAGAHGIGLRDSDRGSTAFGVLQIRNVSVHDNTITLPAGGTTGLVTTRTGFSPANVHFTHNTYNVTSTAAASWMWASDISKNWQQWQQAGNDLTGVHQ